MLYIYGILQFFNIIKHSFSPFIIQFILCKEENIATAKKATADVQFIKNSPHLRLPLILYLIYAKLPLRRNGKASFSFFRKLPPFFYAIISLF